MFWVKYYKKYQILNSYKRAREHAYYMIHLTDVCDREFQVGKKNITIDISSTDMD